MKKARESAEERILVDAVLGESERAELPNWSRAFVKVAVW